MINRLQSLKTKWTLASARKRAIAIGSVLGCLVGSFLIAFAISSYHDSKSAKLENTIGTLFSMDLTGTFSGTEVVPGTKQTLSPSVENKGTVPMYVFIRFDVGVTGSGGNIYSFTPSGNSWTKIDSDDGELLFVYGSSSTPVAVEAGDSADMSGTLTCIASGSDFTGLDSVEVTITGCAIGTDGENGTAAEIYRDYKQLGGD